MTAVTRQDIRAAVRSLGLSDRPVCVHSSLRSFGRVEGGAETVVAALLDEGCTLLVPTFSYQYHIPPPPGSRLVRNGYDDPEENPPNDAPVFEPASNALSARSMGAVPAAVVAHEGRRRGNHPVNSLSAIGPLAETLISGQNPIDVYAPFQRLIELDGFIVLMGVGLTRMTILHLAEQEAGRTLFRRWALDRSGTPMTVAVGSCSEGFDRFAPVLAPIERTMTVGNSLWRVFPASETVALAAQTIRDNPSITHCDDVDCTRCRDAVAGGPILF